MNVGCAGKTVRSLENVCHTYLSALEVCSRQGAIQIHVYLYLYLYKLQRVNKFSEFTFQPIY